MKKVSGRLTAGMFAYYEESVKHFVSNDQAFLFMNQIKGTPAYWEKFQGEGRSVSNSQTIRISNILFDPILS